MHFFATMSHCFARSCAVLGIKQSYAHSGLAYSPVTLNAIKPLTCLYGSAPKLAIRYNTSRSHTDANFLGDVVQLVRTLPCHGRGRGFESRRPRHSYQWLATRAPEIRDDLCRRLCRNRLFCPVDRRAVKVTLCARICCWYTESAAANHGRIFRSPAAVSSDAPNADLLMTGHDG